MAAPNSIVGRVLDHYRVLEQIGAGGMGLVFRAVDEQLERDVAIKVLPVGMLADEAARKRFRREALTLAKLNHPNIGTVYEFGCEEGLDYLVMEFVAGVAVDAKLASGPVPEKEVLRLGFQLADGLACAHDQGVVHRDLKPANLRLTRDNRLKILDFGLAQFVRQEADIGLTASVTTGTQITGTLPYMAPEQLRGEPTDQRADLWAAGAVLYELITGRRPFPQAQAPVLIDAIFNKQPDFPSALNPNVSPGLEMAIVKCLDKDPERRYQSARELRIDLERLTLPISQAFSARFPVPTQPAPVTGAVPAVSATISVATPVSSTGTTTVPVPPGPKRWMIAAISVAIFAIIGVLGFLYWRGHRQPELTTRPITKRRSVAVMSFKNLTARPESAWLSTAIPEMLTTELAAGEKLRTIPGEDVARMKMELSLPDADSLTAKTLGQVGKSLGADLVVAGSYVALVGGKLRVDLRLQDVVSGESLISVQETGDESNLFDLVSKAGAQLREKVGAGQVNPQDEGGVRAALPSTKEAAKFYAEGLAKLRISDAVSARDLLQKAVAADPNHALAHSALAGAWSLLGYDDKARQSAKNAYDLSASLSREDRLLIEARYRETSKEWDNAAGSYRTLFGFFPDNVEYGLLLSKAQIRGGKGKDALETIESLRKLPSPAGDDARIDLAASDAWQSLGDFKQGEALAAQGVAKARAQNTRLLLARALYEEGYSFENLNDAKSAMAAVDEASKIYQAVGDRYGLASTLEVTAGVLSDHGDYPGALSKYREELNIAHEVDNRRAEASALNNMALVLSQQGDSEGARKTWEQSLPIFQEVGDKSGFANTQINLAGLLTDSGDLAGAKKLYEQTLALFREINDQSGIAKSLTAIGTMLDAQGESAAAKKMLDQAVAIELASGNVNPSSDKLIDIGDALQHLGDLPAARKNYEDALALARSAGDKDNAAYALMGLGSIDLKVADFAQAHKDYEEAQTMRTELGEKDNLAATRTAIAALAIEEGHAPDAGTSAREARDEFEAARKSSDEISSSAVLLRALVSQNKIEDAQKELAKTTPIASRSQNLASQLDFALAKAQVEAASGKTGAAQATLKEVLAKATKAGFVGYQLEARLAVETIELKSGKSSASRSRLEQLQKDAKEEGFDLVARKAAAL
ncbi:MAG: tetratricopeptide repeat protein [Terriglobales bacterium]